MAGAVLGIDGCARGWVGIILDAGPVRAVFATRFMDVVSDAEAAAGPAAVVAVDMPIGLLPSRTRQCDVEARSRLGARRRATIFTMPVREALEEATYELANACNRAVTGSGMSRQAWNLAAKIREVEAWRHATGRRAWEVHPELSFAALGDGMAVTESKKSWSGMSRRVALLRASGIALDADLGAAGANAGTDDIIDAAAVAWSARRIRDHAATSIPCPPETGDDGCQIAIWT